MGAASQCAGAGTLPLASARRCRLGARPRRVPFPAGGGLCAQERAGRDVRRATPDVTGPCVVAARLPSTAAPDEGGAVAGCGVQGSRGVRLGRRSGGRALPAAESPLPPLLRPLAAPGPRLPPFQPSFARASGPRRREVPKGAERPRPAATFHAPAIPPGAGSM